MKEIRTRFAPSPTGYMHIGNLRTAIYEYLVAKTQNGKFILRIEDTDQERFVKGAIEVIYSTLKTVGLDYDEGPDISGPYGPYIQSERRPLYREYAQKLVELGGAYYCFCAKERLEQLRLDYESRGETFKYDGHCKSLTPDEVARRIAANEAYVIRQKIPTSGETSFEDLIYGKITMENAQLDEGVLLKSDGMPTYNFANVVDDHLNYSVELYVNKKMKTDCANSLNNLKAAKEVLLTLQPWEHQAIYDCQMTLVNQLTVKNGQVLYPLRIAVSGKEVTPGGAVELMELLGKDETLRRMEIGIGKLSEV
jgi:glutamyl/glutaminyl-tRNA synthetase